MAWSLLEPILHTWEQKEKPALAFYEPGSEGPVEAERLLEQDGEVWL
jgi:glucose-6-phosphate 1-dehydrogenase